jgi:hypothetical protein
MLLVSGALAIGAAGVPAVGTAALPTPLWAGPVTPCGASAVAVTASQAQAATGHGMLTLLFKNVSTRACTLSGYPLLKALDAHGKVIANAKDSLNGFAGGSRHGVATVTLKPGGSASASTEWMNFNAATSGSCTFSHAIGASAPKTGHVVQLARSVSICELQVHPVVPGTSGNS